MPFAHFFVILYKLTTSWSQYYLKSQRQSLNLNTRSRGKETKKDKLYITSIEQLVGREEGLKKGLEQGLKKGLEEGEHRKAIAIAKILLAEGRSPLGIQKLTGLSEKEIMALVDKH